MAGLCVDMMKCSNNEVIAGLKWNITDGKRGEGGVSECANRWESAISQTPLSSLCGQISEERSRDMAALNKQRSQALVTHASGLVLT